MAQGHFRGGAQSRARLLLHTFRQKRRGFPREPRQSHLQNRQLRDYGHPADTLRRIEAQAPDHIHRHSHDGRHQPCRQCLQGRGQRRPYPAQVHLRLPRSRGQSQPGHYVRLPRTFRRQGRALRPHGRQRSGAGRGGAGCRGRGKALHPRPEHRRAGCGVLYGER